MANDAFTQQALANDPRFRLRILNALVTVAWQVLSEDGGTVGHAQRATYARQVLGMPTTFAAQLALSIVMRPNVNNFTTSYDFHEGAVISSTTDADIQSQISTDWSQLAGV